MENYKVGMILEGCGMRGMYTAGVLDTLFENNIEVDGIIGVSAGALFGVKYFSNQKSQVLRYNKCFCNDKKYMSKRSLFLTGNIINKSSAFYKIVKELEDFDNETFKNNNKDFYAVVTNVETGKPEYIKVTDVYEQLEVLRATSAIPFYSKMIEINGKKYLDGGISDSIPVEKCMELGYDKIIIVLTQPITYRKMYLNKRKLLLVKTKFRKYPNLIKTMTRRHYEYNTVVENIIDYEKKKSVFVIRPSEKIDIDLVERDPEKIQKVYNIGVEDCKKMMNRLKKYLGLVKIYTYKREKKKATKKV